MLRVRPASDNDTLTILGFIDEAAGWLAGKGTDQWAEPWPTERERDDRVARAIKDGCTWIVEAEGEPAATISCRPAGNPDLWTEQELGVPAVYVSRLVVRRKYGGRQIGKHLLDWAGLWAARQYGAQWTRIDVWTTNTMLHNYYEQRGFTFLRFCDLVNYPSAALFQKPTTISATDTPSLIGKPTLLPPAESGSSLRRPRTRYRAARPIAALTGLLAAHTATASPGARLTRPRN